jgi:hypothetical protein
VAEDRLDLQIHLTVPQTNAVLFFLQHLPRKGKFGFELMSLLFRHVTRHIAVVKTGDSRTTRIAEAKRSRETLNKSTSVEQ